MFCKNPVLKAVGVLKYTWRLPIIGVEVSILFLGSYPNGKKRWSYVVENIRFSRWKLKSTWQVSYTLQVVPTCMTVSFTFVVPNSLFKI